MAVPTTFFDPEPSKRDNLYKAFNAIMPSVCFIFNEAGIRRGTGFIVASSENAVPIAFIATAAHVIRVDEDHLSKKAVCVFTDGTTHYDIEADLVFAHEKYDIALLKIEREQGYFPKVRLLSDEVPVGFEIATVGFSRAEQSESEEEMKIETYPTLTKGVVSAVVPRQMTDDVLIYQLDTTVLLGGSGGPAFGFARGVPEVFSVIIKRLRLMEGPTNLTFTVSIKYVLDELKKLTGETI